MKYRQLIACLAVSLCCGCWAIAEGKALPLRETARVNQETVFLSDLLPEQASTSSRDEANSLALGRAPDPGSLRVFTADQIAARLSGHPELLQQLTIPSRVVVVRPGWPISSQSVRAAIGTFLQRQGNSFDELPAAAKLRFAAIGSRQPSPSLEAAAVTWDDREQAIEFRLQCVDRALCASFLAHADLPQALAEPWREKLRPQMAERAQPPSGVGVTLTEPGKPATLILDGGNVRIAVQVICLDRGKLNQQIRALDAQSRRIFRAQVVGAHLLHANL